MELVGERSWGGAATGIYLTKHSCHACVSVCGGGWGIMVTQAVWLIQIGGKHHKALAWATHNHTHTQGLCSSPSPLSTRASIQGGQPKDESWAQITPCLILTGFSLYTKAYKNNERGFGST